MSVLQEEGHTKNNTQQKNRYKKCSVYTLEHSIIRTERTLQHWGDPCSRCDKSEVNGIKRWWDFTSQQPTDEYTIQTMGRGHEEPIYKARKESILIFFKILTLLVMAGIEKF